MKENKVGGTCIMHGRCRLYKILEEGYHLKHVGLHERMVCNGSYRCRLESFGLHFSSLECGPVLSLI